MGERWRLPAGMVGDPSLVRIGPGATGGADEYACPAFAAVKVRPAVRASTRSRLPKSRLETFALGPATTALDRIEFHGVSVEKALADLRLSHKPAHPGLASFTDHAVREYLNSGVASADLVPVRDYWVAQKTNGLTWELYAWGRRYQTEDGLRREFRFLRYNEAGARERDRTQIAIAAYAAAFGAPAPWPNRWEQQFQTRSVGVVPTFVRVVEVGLLDGSFVVHFDGSPQQAEEYFASHGRQQISGIAADGPPRAGSTCADCKRLTACPAPPRIPGLLGLPARRAPLRKVSVSDLRSYQKCSAQAHLRSLNLPRANEYSDEANLGHAVHAYLEQAHKDTRIGCGSADMPGEQDNWPAERWHLPSEMAQVGAQMLAHHPGVCAFRNAKLITDARSEPTLTFHDTAAQAIVIAKPDLLYLDDGSWVWREVKTTQKPRWFHDDLLDEFPQLALAVVLLAESALGGDPAASRVELEVLRPEGSEISMIDPTDPERVTKARAVLRRLAEPWRGDEVFEAQPGRNCRWCPVSRWCPSRLDDNALENPGEA